MDNTNILFMFLGGLSTDKHTILHYQKFFNRLKKSVHNNSLYIVSVYENYSCMNHIISSEAYFLWT